MAFAPTCPSANEESQERRSTQDEHYDGDEHCDEDGERARSTVVVRDAEQKHGCSLVGSLWSGSDYHGPVSGQRASRVGASTASPKGVSSQTADSELAACELRVSNTHKP